VTDADALRSLLQRYARAADSRDVDALAALFHPDATIRGTRGAQSITEWLDTMRGPRAFPMSMHVLGDPLIELVEGADGGTLDTYAVVYQLGDRDAGQNDLVLGMLRRHRRACGEAMGDPPPRGDDALDARAER
jgi:SnoaL-like domain